MRVRLLVSRAGVGFAQAPGDEIEVSDEEAKRLIEANQAAPVRRQVEPERATKRGKKESR